MIDLSTTDMFSYPDQCAVSYQISAAHPLRAALFSEARVDLPAEHRAAAPLHRVAKFQGALLTLESLQLQRQAISGPRSGGRLQLLAQCSLLADLTLLELAFIDDLSLQLASNCPFLGRRCGIQFGYMIIVLLLQKQLLLFVQQA